MREQGCLIAYLKQWCCRWSLYRIVVMTPKRPHNQLITSHTIQNTSSSDRMNLYNHFIWDLFFLFCFHSYTGDGVSACRFSVSVVSVCLLCCFTSMLLLSLFVLKWRVRFKPRPGEGALGVSESNLAPFFKHDKSTSLCATNMSVIYRCHDLSTSFQLSFFLSTYQFLFGGLRA